MRRFLRGVGQRPRPATMTSRCRRRRLCLCNHQSYNTAAIITTTGGGDTYRGGGGDASKFLFSTDTTTASGPNNNDAVPTASNNDHERQEEEEEKDEASNEEEEEAEDHRNLSSARRVWRHHADEDRTHTQQQQNYWTSRIDQRYKLEDLIKSIQERATTTGGSMRRTQLGVWHDDPAIELRHLVDNYTVPAIASALRDREDALQYAATLAADPSRHDALIQFLRQYHPRYILERRSEKYQSTNIDPVWHLNHVSARQVLRKSLMRMPRTVTTSFTKRAGVCLALGWTNHTAVLVLEKRATNLRNHADEVCLPGGMVCDIRDETIVSTSIREMKEEIRGLDDVNVEVLGILRLNWGEVHHLTGVAVTPVVCYLGELPDTLAPSPDEVSEVFTIPLVDLVNNDNWVHKEGLAPIFVGGPHVIWGLTGYILERFRKDILRPLRREFKNNAADQVPIGSTTIDRR